MNDLIEGQFVKLRSEHGPSPFGGEGRTTFSWVRFVGWFDGQAVVEFGNGKRHLVLPADIFPCDFPTPVDP